MNRDGLMELRVLTGIHAGARALLLLADGPLRLGSGDGCELILSDEGVLSDHASLRLDEGGSIVLRWGQGESPPVVLQPGEGFCAGSVQIAVERFDTPWREPLRLHTAQASPQPQVPDEDINPATQAVPPPSRARRVTTALMASGGAGLLALGVFLLPGTWAPGTGDVSQLPLTHREVGNTVDPLAVAIGRLGLGTRATIDRSDANVPLVRTRFLTDDEVEALAFSVSRLSPRPQVLAASSEELLAAVSSAVQETTANDGPPLSVRALAGSRFRVEGRVADETRRTQVMTALERAFPDAPGFDYGLTTDEEAATAMLSELQQQSGANVTGRWDSGRLRVQAQVVASGQARWERALQAAAARHGVLFEASVNTAPDRAGATLPPKLPFTIRSAVSGATPYVVLADGRQLMPGARHDGWILIDIQPDAIRFENVQGQKVTYGR